MLRALDALWLRFSQLSVERSCAELLDTKEEALLQQQLERAAVARSLAAGCSPG